MIVTGMRDCDTCLAPVCCRTCHTSNGEEAPAFGDWYARVHRRRKACHKGVSRSIYKQGERNGERWRAVDPKPKSNPPHTITCGGPHESQRASALEPSPSSSSCLQQLTKASLLVIAARSRDLLGEPVSHHQIMGGGDFHLPSAENKHGSLPIRLARDVAQEVHKTGTCVGEEAKPCRFWVAPTACLPGESASG